MRKTLLLVAAVVLVAMMVAGSVFSAPAGTTSGPTLVARTTTVSPGQTIYLSGTGYAPSTYVSLTWNKDPWWYWGATATNKGTIKSSFVVPANTAPGMYTIYGYLPPYDYSVAAVSLKITVK